MKEEPNKEEEQSQELAKFGVVEIEISLHKGATAQLKRAYAVGFDGRALISDHFFTPNWSYDREEVEKRVRFMTTGKEE